MARTRVIVYRVTEPPFHNNRGYLTGRPVMSEYFLAGLKDGGASIPPSVRWEKKSCRIGDIVDICRHASH